MAITENYSVLMDLPLMHSKGAIDAGRASIIFKGDMQSRFAVLPRFGSNEDVKWFETKPAYIYHVINAWEEGDEIIMDVCNTKEPTPMKKSMTAMEKLNAYLRLEANVYRYHFNLKTGQTREYDLDDRPTEFPMMNSRLLGRKTKYAYNQRFDNSEKMRFDALVKYNLDDQEAQVHVYGKGKFGSEAPFVPKANAKDEDDGYVVTFVTEENTEESEAFIYDAKAVDNGPLARIQIPQRVPLGFHGCWVNGDRLFN
jgi:carotenoid cleavage dioxygenase